VVAVDLVVDGVAGVCVAIFGYLFGRFHAARKHGTWPRHVRVSVDVRHDELDDDRP
jgi:hypothetical protein